MNEPVHTLIEDLDVALRQQLRLRRAESLPDFLGKDKKDARYLREPRLTVAQHFDIAPAFLIYDPLLGTIGVVEVIKAGDDGSSTATVVRRCVDHTTYLRHLLLRDRQLGERAALATELVLVTADSEHGREGLAAIGEALREALRDSNSLSQVGISVLRHGGADRFEDRLRRAFPWLLQATRRWLESPRARRGAEPDAAPSILRELTLTDYRLPGRRKLAFAEARVHLVHGPNGSGKSSIAEALELVASGKVQRLEQAGEKSYDRVIPYAKSANGTKVELAWLNAAGERTQHAFSVQADGVERPLAAAVDAGSYRLDQPLMDRLVGYSSHARAKTFLQAFFPDAVNSLAQYEQAAALHRTTLEGLARVIERLRAAREALFVVRDWRGGAKREAAEPFPELLNRWLEQTALLDLVQRARGMHATLRAAADSGWKPSDATIDAAVALLGHATDDAPFARAEQDCKAAIDALQAQLASFTASPAISSSRASAAQPVPRLSVEALNAVSPLLFEATELTSFGLLGNKTAAVINLGAAPTYGSIVIGADKWAEPVLADIDRMLEACAALARGEQEVLPWPGKGLCTEFEAARGTHATLAAAAQKLSVDFMDELRPDAGMTSEFDGSLISALNELMALFTPARWAYFDITLPHTVGSGRLDLGIQTRDTSDHTSHDVRAELRLNTAELNLYTVALFLLCIGRVPKPLNLLVFDDPLQNMDELTATALARGITKLVRLWEALGRKEELLLLFHGADDLELFRAEIPAAVYHLPWLSPSALPTPLDIPVTRPPVDALAVQSLTDRFLRISD
jgi:energy-coupling factor transporter ATP-binding protein EcfA2